MKKSDKNTSTKTIHYIGIDVSKARLDIAGLDGLTSVENTPEGHKKLINKLSIAEHHVALEATGGYEDRLIIALHNKGIRLSRIEPSRVRHYAKSMGIKAKNDKIDAQMIAAYSEHAQLPAAPTPSKEQSTLKALCNVRIQLVTMRATLTKQIKQTLDPQAIEILKDAAKDISGRISALEKKIKEQMSKEEFAGKAKRLESIKGMGLAGISGILAYLPEAGAISDAKAATLVGVAPYDNDSGTSSKPRKIQGGRVKLRNILYMNAVCCVRHNTILKGHYQRLRARGKPAKKALVAVMRKLVILINRVMTDEEFCLAPEPEKAKKLAAS